MVSEDCTSLSIIMNMNPFFQASIVMLSAASLQAGELDVFNNALATELKAGVTSEEVAAMTSPQLRAAAEKMLKEEYSPDYLVASYPAMRSPRSLGRELGVGSSYSNYQGVTGVVLIEGPNTVIVEGLPEGAKAAILVPDWMRQPQDAENPSKDPNGWGLKKETYPIQNGVNHLDIKQDGLAYVSYFFDDPSDKPAIKVHFVNGRVNGFFDARVHNNQDWDNLLVNAEYPILDAVGEHIQVAYTVEALSRYAPSRGVELINCYDKMMKTQYDLMGLTKYNRIPTNKLLARVQFNYYMFRDGDGVAYMGGRKSNAMGMVADPDRVTKGDPCWGFNHEVGHAHQLHPFFCWGGMTEVSNNIFSLQGNITLGTESRLKQGNYYAKARRAIIDRGISHLECNDVLCRLVPLWQLQLYFTRNGQPDFYADLFEIFRNQLAEAHATGHDHFDRNPAVHQLNFVKQACVASKTDLTDFFTKWGYFVVGEFQVKDYGTYTYKMTQEMVDACKAEIDDLNLPKPSTDPSTMED